MCNSKQRRIIVAEETVVEERQEETKDAGEITVRELLDAGLHFGHQTKRWNPKMKPFIFDKRNGIHIIDLTKSLVMIQESVKYVYNVARTGDSILFVGTKKQAQSVIKDVADDSNQPYVSHRWLGGMLTNSDTIRQRVKRLKELERMEGDGTLESMHKKEASKARHELEKLRRNLSGVADMAKLPGAMFVVDINREAIAVKEANLLNIPVIAMVDTNCDPDQIDYPIAGNDDAIRAIRLVATEIANAAKKGNAEYARIAAEEAKKREAEAKKAAEARAKAKAEADKLKKEKADAEKKAKAEAKKTKKPAEKSEKKGDEVKKAEAPEKAEKAAKEPKAKEPEKKETKAKEPKAEEKAAEKAADESK
jgi:small subunit ribosomal protein S2